MEKRITLRLPQQMYNSLEKEARQTGMTISDAIRDRIKHSMDFESLTHEVQNPPICLCGHPYDLHYGSPTGERDEPCLADDCECENFESRGF